MKNHYRTFSLFIPVLLLLLPDINYATSASPKEDSYRFVQNKNQWEDKILYQANLAGGKLFLEKNAFTFSFYRGTDIDNIHNGKSDNRSVVQQFAYRMTFKNAEPSLQVIGSDTETEYNNYFIGNDPDRWASKVPIYKEIKYTGIYKGIDMRLYTHERHLKYDYIVKPGGDISKIETIYEGLDSMKLINGNLVLYALLGEIKELRPFAYQYHGKQLIKVPCEFVLNNNIVSFRFPGDYNRSLELIIDPTLVFSTFTGATTDNWGYTATYDDEENGYSGGISFATGYPTSLGAYQTAFQGGVCDVAIIKYNPTGTSRIFATYLGGNTSEQPHSMIADNNGNLYVFGITGSANFPTTVGAYNRTFSAGVPFVANAIQFPNGSDIFVSKLSADGTQMLASTFVGGSGNDGINQGTLVFNYGDGSRGEITIDAQGNAYIASSTSSSNFPTVSAPQNSLAGQQDAVCFKLNSGLAALNWSTYLGGTANDAGYALFLDQANGVFVTGGTESNNFPTTAGTLHPTLMGGRDGFITHISPNGSSILSSTFIGTNQHDQSYFIQLDQNEAVYVYGQTAGSYPVSPAGVYNNPNSGQFIHKLNNALTSTIYSTVVGTGQGGPDISPTAFLVDKCEKVYISGWGGTLGTSNFPTSRTVGLPVTANAYDPTTNNNDFYFMVLEKNITSLIYATFFGGPNTHEHVDGGTSRFDKKGVIYQSICGGCGGLDDMPTTAGCWSSTNNATNCNNALVKFYLEILLVLSDFPDDLSPISSCDPTINFTNQSVNGITYEWDFGDSQTSTDPTPSHTYAAPGTYRVRLIAFNPAACNLSDTTFRDVIIAAANVTAGSDKDVCLNQSVSIGNPAMAGYTYSWSPSTGLVDPNASQTQASPTVNTTYILTGVLGICSSKDTVIVNVKPLPTADAGANKAICSMDTVLIGLASIPNRSYSWSPVGTLNDPSLATPKAFPVVSTTYTMVITNTVNSCTASDQMVVNTTALPVADAGPDKDVCNVGSTVIGTIGNPSYTYTWSPTSTLNNESLSNPTASPTVLTTYTVTVVDPGSNCKNTDAVIVSIVQPPVISAGPDISICIGSGLAIGTGNNPAFVYSWSPAAGLNNSSSPSPVASPTINTTYIVTGNYASVNCPRQDTIIVNVRPIPVAFAGIDQSICPGSTAAIGTGNNSAHSYSWSPAGSLSDPNISSPLANPSSTTIYALTVTDIAAGCSNTDQVEVKVVSPQALTGPDVQMCSKDTVQLGAPDDPTLIYQWSPSAGLSSTNISNPTASPTVSTTYTLNVTDNDFGCMNQAQVVVLVNPLPPVDAGPPASICENNQVNIGSPGIPNHSYAWLPASDLNNPSLPAPIASPTLSTRYYLTITNNINQCKNRDSVDVIINPLPVADAGRDTAFCIGFSTQLGNAPTANYNYSWASDASLSSINVSNPIASPVASRTYYLTVTDALSGCSKNDQVQVNINLLPIAEAGDNDTLCSGGNKQIGTILTPGYTYLWSPPTDLDASNIPNPTATALTSSRKYYLTVTDPNSCVKNDSVEIIVLAFPSFDAGPDKSICKGDAVRIGTIGSSSYQYNWSPATFLNDPNVSNPITTPTVSTTYTVNASYNGSGLCPQSQEVIVIVNRPVMPAIVNQSICIGSGTNIGAPPQAHYIYTWVPSTGLSNPSVSDPFANPTITTVYKLIVEDNNNACKDSTAITVIVNSLPVIEAGADQPICNGENYQLGSIINPAPPVYSYTWNPTLTLDDPALARPRATPPLGTTKYYVTASDGICNKTDSITITVNPLPQLNTVSRLICAGDSVTLSIGTDPVIGYIWSPVSGLSDPSKMDPRASPLVNTTYSVTATNGFNCKSNTTAMVNIALNNLSIEDSIKLCKFSGIALNPVSTASSYSWSPTVGLSNPFIRNPFANPVISTTYVLTVSEPDWEGNLCIKKDSIVIDVSNDTLHAFAGNSPDTICKGVSFTLSPVSSGGAETYTWSSSPLFNNSLNTSDSTALINLIPKQQRFYLRISNAYCSDTSSILLQKDSVLVAITGDTVCLDQLAHINVQNLSSGSLQYLWTPSDRILNSSADMDSLVISGAKNNSIIKLTAINSNQCLSTDSVLIIVSKIDPSEAYADKYSIYEGESVNLQANPANSADYTYLWSPSEGLDSTSFEKIASPSYTTTYSLEITQRNAPYCRISDTTLITVNKKYPCGDPGIFIPNAFSPDGNGTNDILFVRGNNIKTMEFAIYNRWGEKVFESSAQNSGWDGTYQGKPAEQAVYVYYLKATCIEDGVFIKKGNITLLR